MKKVMLLSIICLFAVASLANGDVGSTSASLKVQNSKTQEGRDISQESVLVSQKNGNLEWEQHKKFLRFIDTHDVR